jgi:hypothetical protein
MFDKKIRNIFFIYVIAHGLSLLSFNGIFFDDLWLYSYSQETMFQTMRLAGDYFNNRAFLFSLLLRFDPIVIKLLSFILFFISSVLIRKCIKEYFIINNQSVDLFTVLYLILPFSLSKFTLAAIPYLLYLNLFLLGWSLMKHNRLLSLIFFMISFNLQSLLCLYILPFFSYYIKINKIKLFKLNNFINFSFKNVDLVISPFLFYLIKQIYFPPTGIMQDYNKDFSITGLISTPILQILDLFRNNLSIATILIGFLISLLIYRNFFNKNFNLKKNFNPKLVFFVTFFSLFPYWILTITPTFSGFGSRHQILMLISFPFLIIYFLGLLKIEYKKIILIFIFSLSLGVNFKIYADFIIESQKQKKLFVFLKNNNNKLSGNNLIIMNDKTKNPTVSYYNLQSLYYNGMLKLVLNNEKNYFIDISQKNDYFLGKFDDKFNEYYIASEHYRDTLSSTYILNIDSHGFLKYEFLLSKQ